MFGFIKNQTHSIGIDIGYDDVKLAQLGTNGNGLMLIAGNSKERPNDIRPNSLEWQKWAIEAMHLITNYGDFRGKEIIAAMPANDIFIDHVKKPKVEGRKLDDAIFTKIKQKLPFESLRDNTLMQCIPSEEDNVIVMAVERKIVNRHLAMYEEAGLAIKSICVWPVAMANCYVRFFGRRRSDLESVVMLICIESDCTNVVVCRHKNLLLARSVAIGVDRFDDEQAVTRLVMELTACKRQFGLMYRNPRIERLIFLSGRNVAKEVCATIAKQLEMPAQMGDCLTAVDVAKSCRLSRDSGDRRDQQGDGFDRRDSTVNWSVPFGLSLS
jgi:Tfp pilus assembly PilM family ATPase